MDSTNTPFFVAIGASGGEGLGDIRDLLQALPQPLDAVVMVVLHRPSDVISHLRAILARGCAMPVVVAEEAEALLPGTCYIGEPDGHLTLVARDLAHLLLGEGDRLRNRTVDTLFHSVACHAGPRVIGVVLSGALDDGSRGLAAIKGCRRRDDGAGTRRQAPRHAAERHRLRRPDQLHRHRGGDRRADRPGGGAGRAGGRGVTSGAVFGQHLLISRPAPELATGPRSA